MRQIKTVGLVAVLFFATATEGARAQSRKLIVIDTDSVPVQYAFVTIDGGTGQITNEKGEVSLGAGKRRTASITARRIGYEPAALNLALPDTAAAFRIVLRRMRQALGAVRITGREPTSEFLRTFYDRWEMRQKGLLSATFIGPEEIELRHPDKITNMLSGLNGVSFRRTAQGDLVAFGNGNTCQMAIMVDGMRQCPSRGCKCEGCTSNMPSLSGRDTATLSDMTAVPIDRILDASDVMGIEVYTRGGNMPISLAVSDAGCGVIALWTGSRKR